MALTTKTQASLVQSQVAAMQASCASLLDFGIGSVLLAFCQSVAAVALWLQALIIQQAALTRLATSTGSDVDSFIADFGMTRLPAVAATGAVTFSRFSATGAASIPVGSTVESADGTQSFSVTADPTNPAYVATSNAYSLAAGVTSLSVPIQAQTPGAAGNVGAGVVSVISGAIPGVDTVANPAPLINGADAESDAAVRARFVLFINSRSQGNAVAIDYAVASVQQNLTYKLVENYSGVGCYQPGAFFVVIDNGSTTPSVPATLVSAVQVAVGAARPLCSQYGVLSRTLLPITVTMTITGGSEATVQAALAAYIAGAGLGGTISYAKLSQVAFNADPNVTNVTGVTLNGGTVDVVATAAQKPSVGTITVGP